MDDRDGKQTSGPAAAPEQMERRITMLDTMRSMLGAAKPLYAVLSDDQKKTADELMGEHLTGMRARGM